MPSLGVRSKDLNYIINKYRNHPSIKTIKENFPNVKKFAFQLVSTEDVKKVIKDLKTNKSVGGEIPTQILKESEFTFETLENCINQSLKTTGEFPGSLKLGNLTPIYKKDDLLDKSNYRPVSILPLLSKVYERIIYKQLSQHAEQFLNKILCGFRKTHSTQHALFKLLQSWQKELDYGGFVGTILMDLSKAYDCISHELLVAKLECYGLDELSLKLVLDYLSNRKQRTKIGSSFSYWFDISVGVPQGSILGPLLLNIFINDLFFMIIRSDVCSFADDNTLYSCDKKLENIFVNLKIDLKNVLYWFQVNSLKANPGKFQFLILGDKKNNSFVLNILDKEIKNSSEVELLDITIDSQLKFKKHINNLCRKAFLTVEKAKSLLMLL